MFINGWQVYFHNVFISKIRNLHREVKSLKAQDPTGFIHHPKAKVFSGIIKSIQRVPLNPDDPEFRLGGALGDFTSWRRVKNGLLPRYRLFFKFFSTPKEIFFAWFNDEFTLRKDGDKNDVYKVFQRLLSRQEIPEDIKTLRNTSQEKLPS